VAIEEVEAQPQVRWVVGPACAQCRRVNCAWEEPSSCCLLGCA